MVFIGSRKEESAELKPHNIAERILLKAGDELAISLLGFINPPVALRAERVPIERLGLGIVRGDDWYGSRRLPARASAAPGAQQPQKAHKGKEEGQGQEADRKGTRLNSSHVK